MSKQMYPIQDGPSVPWEVMSPHESQCQKNHQQSIDRIAERGGFACSEAWCVVNGIHWFDMEKTIGHEEAKRRWIEYAERINLHYDRLTALEAVVEQCEKALNDIASWSEGPTVGPSFDEPASAQIARDALTAIRKVKGTP